MATVTQPDYGALSPVTRTLNDVMLAVKRQFGDESGVQLEDADIIRWTNEAQSEINNRNRVIKAIATTQSVPGQASYGFPEANILQIESISYDNKLIPNVPFPSAQAMMRHVDPKLTLQGVPELWYEWAGVFTFWPVPSAEKDIELFYTAKPKQVSDTTDLLSVPDKYFQIVVGMVMQYAYEMDENWQAVQIKQQQLEQQITNFGQEERTAENMTYPVIGVIGGEDLGGWIW